MSTLADLQAELVIVERKLVMFREAEDAVLRGGQQFTVEDGDMRRTVTRADAKWLSEQIRYFESRKEKLNYDILNNGNTGRSGIYVRLM